VLSNLTARWKARHSCAPLGPSPITRVGSDPITPTFVVVRPRSGEFEAPRPISPVPGGGAQLFVKASCPARVLPRAPEVYRATSLSTVALPADLILVTMSFLPEEHFAQCARVSKGWRVLVRYTAKLNLREARLLLNEGLSLMSATNYPIESIGLFTKAIDLCPTLAEASFWKAKGLFILNNEPAAVVCLEAALARKPALVDQMKLQACLQYANGDDLTASRILEIALQKAPNDASLHFELGFCCHGLLQFNRAINSYSRALELKYQRSFVLLANRANCLFRVGKVKESLEDLEASLRISPSYELALRTRAFVHMHLGNPGDAHQDYTTIIENSTSPKIKSDAYCNRAFCYGEMDEEDMEKALATDPTNPEPVRYKASVLANRGCLTEAVECVTAWLAANLTHKERYSQLAFRAEVYALLGEFRAAMEDYREAIHLLLKNKATLGSSVAESITTYSERLRELAEDLRRPSSPL